MEVKKGDDIRIRTGFDLPNFIFDKIAKGVDEAIEKPGLRPFRELLQNSDDARSSTMTIRFDKDRMYLHNDGYTIDERFVNNISKIFEQSKKADPETSGNFGTGFRSTYLYTDAPELEWICHSDDDGLEYRVYELPMGMDDNLDWNPILEEDEVKGHYHTFGRENEEPDEDGLTRLGVIFRFPWRAKNQWADSPGWDDYTWGIDEVRGLAEDFREYAPTALLACRHLKSIRIIMAGAAKNEEEMWDFVATRDRTISEIQYENSMYDEITDEINLKFATLPRDSSFFDCSSGKWARTVNTGHGWYDPESLAEQVSESEDVQTWSYSVYGSIRDGRGGGVDERLAEKLGFWNISLVLMPRFPDAPKLPIYTPIPLAGTTRNRFGIVAMLPPEESRLHVSVADEDKKSWLKANIAAVADTYAEFAPRHIESIIEELGPNTENTPLGPDAEEAGDALERTIIACIPKDAPNTWFGKGGQLGAISEVVEATQNTDEWVAVDETAIAELSKLPIAFIDGSMVPLSETCYSWGGEGETTTAMQESLRLLRAPVLSDNWAGFWEETRISSTLFFDQVIKFWIFTNSPSLGGRGYDQQGSRSVSDVRSFSDMISRNWEHARDDGNLERASEVILTGLCEDNLVEGWKESARRLIDVPCIITEGNSLMPIAEVVDTSKLPELSEILPGTRKIKDSVREDYIAKIRSVNWTSEFREAIKPTGKRIIKLIDRDTRIRPSIHSDLEANPAVYKAVSVLLRFALDTGEDARGALGHDEMRELRFVPCKRAGKVSTMQINILPGGETWGFGKFQSHTTRNYHREFIFKDPEGVPPDLPLEVSSRLRFLQLHPDVTPDLVSNALLLNATGKGDQKSNLIRTLLFEFGAGLSETQPSLYRDGELEEWLSYGAGGLSKPMHLPPPQMECPECESELSFTDEAIGKDDQECYYCGESFDGGGFRWHCADEACSITSCADCDQSLSHIEEDTPQSLQESDLKRIKLDLLISLLKPYNEEVAGGNGIEKAPSIPMVLGSDGIWRTGDNYCLSLDQSISHLFDELAAVDERILENISEGVLRQLGVQDTLGPKASLPVIQELLEDEDTDSLSKIMIALLSSDQIWSETDSDGDLEAWEELQEETWLPTLGGEILEPSAVLFPSETNVELMGSLYQNFPPTEAWAELRERCEAGSIDLGMMKTPTRGMLMLAFCGYHTDANDQKKALDELTRRLSKKDSLDFSELDWGPHEGIDRAEFNITLRDSSILENEPEIWSVVESSKAQELKQIFGSKFQVVTNHNLLHIDKSSLKALRKMDLLPDGPSRSDILEKLAEEHHDPIIVNGLWDLLLEHPVPSGYGDSDLRAINDGLRVKFCFDDESEVLVLSESIIITSDPDKHGETQLDGRLLYYAEDESEGETGIFNWLQVFGAPLESAVSSIDYISALEGEELSPSTDAARLHAIKKALPSLTDDVYLFVWSGEGTVTLIRIDEESGHDQAINPRNPEWIILPAFRDFPIVHIRPDDDFRYLSWVRDLECEGVVRIEDVTRLEPDTENSDFTSNASLTRAFGQIMTALEKLHPTEFANSEQAKLSCRMGRGGIPVIMTMEWDGYEEEAVAGKDEQACLYVSMDDELTVFVDEDDRIGNAESCSRYLAEGLIDKAPWFEYAKVRDESQGHRFRKKIAETIRVLLDTPTDEWVDYDERLDLEWEPHGRLFESNTAYQMRRKLTGMYGGCQICGSVTPTSEHSDETKESLIAIIKERGSPYYGKRDHSLPLGTQLWLCPRHRILWERKLIRLSFIEQSFGGRHQWGKSRIPDSHRIMGIDRMGQLRDEWVQGDNMDVEVYDQTTDFTGSRSLEPKWNRMSMDVTEEHAKEIINRMIGLLDD